MKIEVPTKLVESAPIWRDIDTDLRDVLSALTDADKFDEKTHREQRKDIMKTLKKHVNKPVYYEDCSINFVKFHLMSANNETVDRLFNLQSYKSGSVNRDDIRN